jgi:site-specific DNA-cytosine methylase
VPNAIEFFSGVGGWHHALNLSGINTSVVSAYDVSEVANEVYALNLDKMPNTRELASVSADEINAQNADTWLLSPPCQPFCRMGSRKDLEDPRNVAFMHLMDLLPVIRPKRLVLENVEGFLESNAYTLLSQRLEALGFKWRTFSICPTQFGIPNRRPRVYVAASVDGVMDAQPPSIDPVPLSAYLDVFEKEDGHPDLYLSDEIIARHGLGMDMVTPDSTRSACFIGGYGKRYVGSGSFLKTPRGIRRFSPKEISRILGYPANFGFPAHLPMSKQYKLLGNSLSIVVAVWVLMKIFYPPPFFR